ncbi:hypothetical protein [Lactococcus lactis]|uniref:Ribbon-helix-helix protein CopG domain-containing protein n=1 Tax=Lactococcus lactis TaxID=1358 RepID=A0AAW8UKT1_9LACT|nr:hypothetical protein [Lactococcus lactis]MDT2882381.1 hypothetical protein [Lactococcus lactis]MDT2946931.1 hypothetical protein [Lactococcus lactis]
MNILIRSLTDEQLVNLDLLAQKNKLSRDKLISKIIGEYLDGKNFLAAHRTFFKEEVDKIIPTLEKNNQVMERALSFLEEEQAHGD